MPAPSLSSPSPGSRGSSSVTFLNRCATGARRRCPAPRVLSLRGVLGPAVQRTGLPGLRRLLGWYAARRSRWRTAGLLLAGASAMRSTGCSCWPRWSSSTASSDGGRVAAAAADGGDVLLAPLDGLGTYVLVPVVRTGDCGCLAARPGAESGPETAGSAESWLTTWRSAFSPGARTDYVWARRPNSRGGAGPRPDRRAALLPQVGGRVCTWRCPGGARDERHLPVLPALDAPGSRPSCRRTGGGARPWVGQAASAVTTPLAFVQGAALGRQRSGQPSGQDAAMADRAVPPTATAATPAEPPAAKRSRTRAVVLVVLAVVVLAVAGVVTVVRSIVVTAPRVPRPRSRSAASSPPSPARRIVRAHRRTCTSLPGRRWCAYPAPGAPSSASGRQRGPARQGGQQERQRRTARSRSTLPGSTGGSSTAAANVVRRPGPGARRRGLAARRPCGHQLRGPAEPTAARGVHRARPGRLRRPWPRRSRLNSPRPGREQHDRPQLRPRRVLRRLDARRHRRRRRAARRSSPARTSPAASTPAIRARCSAPSRPRSRRGSSSARRCPTRTWSASAGGRWTSRPRTSSPTCCTRSVRWRRSAGWRAAASPT